MLTTENFKKLQEKCNKRGKLGRGAITYDSPCRPVPSFKLKKTSLTHRIPCGLYMKLKKLLKRSSQGERA